MLNLSNIIAKYPIIKTFIFQFKQLILRKKLLCWFLPNLEQCSRKSTLLYIYEILPFREVEGGNKWATVERYILYTKWEYILVNIYLHKYKYKYIRMLNVEISRRELKDMSYTQERH